jgi:polyribonucleotide nucleotidyltransferase
MVESGGDECPMDILKEAFVKGQEVVDRICAIQSEFLAKFGEIQQKSITINYPSEQQFAEMETVVTMEDIASLQDLEKTEFDAQYKVLEKRLYEHFKPIIDVKQDGWKGSTVGIGFFQMVKKYIRKGILTNKKRIDSRGMDDIRTIFCETALVPRAHGCGLFWRGDSQILSMLTLGAPGDSQKLDDMEIDDGEKRFMHHYKMPPFSNNEAMMIRGTSRREIGHGRLAEKALELMIPSKEDFPYTIRIVSEVLGSGGSTSMASVCGSTLALLDAGVHIRKPVSGIAMGLIVGGDDEIVLTDISGTEDFIGDMDFKLAGTQIGMTAIQMDIKIKGIKLAKIMEIIDRAHAGRTRILDFMLQTIDIPRAALSPHAPCIEKFKVEPEQVREIIGSGGSVIQEIIRLSNGVDIDIQDDGA